MAVGVVADMIRVGSKYIRRRKGLSLPLYFLVSEHKLKHLFSWIEIDHHKDDVNNVVFTKENIDDESLKSNAHALHGQM